MGPVERAGARRLLRRHAAFLRSRAVGRDLGAGAAPGRARGPAAWGRAVPGPGRARAASAAAGRGRPEVAWARVPDPAPGPWGRATVWGSGGPDRWGVWRSASCVPPGSGSCVEGRVPRRPSLTRSGLDNGGPWLPPAVAPASRRRCGCSGARPGREARPRPPDRSATASPRDRCLRARAGPVPRTARSSRTPLKTGRHHRDRGARRIPGTRGRMPPFLPSFGVSDRHGRVVEETVMEGSGLTERERRPAARRRRPRTPVAHDAAGPAAAAGPGRPGAAAAHPAAGVAGHRVPGAADRRDRDDPARGRLRLRGDVAGHAGRGRPVR